MFPPEDSQGLYNKPVVPNAISWSEDNLLAVASGAAAVILNPCNLSGPRAYTATGLSDLELLELADVPQDAEENIHRHILHMRKPGFGNKLQSDVAVKSLAWSPAGCSSTGGCLLTTVTDDHRVRVFACSEEHGSQWTPIADLSEAVKEHLTNTEWKEEDDAATAAAPASGNTSMRLRGGAPARHQERTTSGSVFSKGAKVEVFNDEDGLRGSWLGGRILELKRYFALVMYDLVRDEEDPSKPLCEWFLLHAADSLDQTDVPKGHTCHAEASYIMRPVPSSADTVMEGTPAVGDKVDVRKEGAWWEATVTAINPERRELRARMCHSRQKPLKCAWDAIRPTLIWTEGAFRRVGEPKKEASGQDPSPSRGKKPRLAGPDEDEEVNALRKADLSSEQAARVSVPESFAHRFFQLRSQIPDRRLPKYAAGNVSFASTDEGLVKRVLEELQDTHGSQLAKLHLLEKWLLLQGRTRICEGWDMKKDPLATCAKHAAGRQRVGAGVRGEAAEKHRQDPSTKGRKAAATVPAGLTEVDPFGLSTLAAASAAVEKQAKVAAMSAPKAPQKPAAKTRTRQAGGQQDDRSAAEAYGSRGSKRQPSGKQAISGKQGETAEVQSSRQKKRKREPEEEMRPARSNRAKRGAQQGNGEAAGEAEEEAVQQQLSRRVPSGEGTSAADADGSIAADEDVAQKSAATRKRARKPARKAAAAAQETEESMDAVGPSKRHRGSENGEEEDGQPGADGYADVDSAGTEDDDFRPDAQVQSESNDDSDGGGSASDVSLQNWSKGRPRGRRKVAGPPAGRGRGRGRKAGGERRKEARKAVAKGTVVKESPYIPPGCQVPEDFDKSVLLPLDYEDKYTFNKTLEEAFVERWLVLRLQVPEQDIPTYQKGGHLRGPDVQLYEQVRAEITHIHGEQLDKLKLTQKWLNTEMKRMIRTHVINPSVKALEGVELEGAEGTPRLSATEEALKKFRKRREKLLEPSEGEDEPEEVVVDRTPKRRSLLPRSFGRRRSIKASEAHGPLESRISTALYERRLATLSFTDTAWSPLVRPAEGVPFAILAAGTKAGRVWLWRYTPPVPSLSSGSMAVREGFALIGSCQVHSSWVTVLRWATAPVDGSLLLCSGSSDGSLRLLCATTAALAGAVSPPGPADGSTLLGLLGAVCQPDLRSVVCLDFAIEGSTAAGGVRLSIAAGKQSGCLLAWSSPSLLNLGSQQIAKAALARGRLVQDARAHGTMALTSVLWLEPGMLLSTGLDGRTRMWRVTDDQLAPLADVDVTRDLAPALGGGTARTATYGATLSGNRLIAAVAMETAHATRDHLQESMAYKKIMKGSLRIVPLALPTSPGAVVANLRSAVARLSGPAPPSPAALWDVAAMLHHLAESARRAAVVEDDDVEGELEGGEGMQEEEIGACKAQLTQEVLEELEGSFVRLMGAPASKKKGAGPPDLFASMNASAWQGLQAATLVRRLLHPQRLAQAVNSMLANRGEEVQPSGFVREWDAIIRRNELALLQRHLHSRLTSDLYTDEDSQLSRLLACDWLTQNAKHHLLRPELLALREAGYAACGQACPPEASAELPSREQCPWTDTRFGLSRNQHPLASALSAEIIAEDGKQTLPRCAASMMLCTATSVWACTLCKRRYRKSNQVSSGCCIFCGTRIGPLPSASSLNNPGWPRM